MTFWADAGGATNQGESERKGTPEKESLSILPKWRRAVTHTRLALKGGAGLALPDRRSTRVTSRFNSETGELKIYLGFANPTAEKTALNQLITDAKKKGLRLITLFIESEVANELSTYVFLLRNKFTRNEGREGDTHGQLVWEKKIS